jgi:hypothetical protein
VRDRLCLATVQIAALSLVVGCAMASAYRGTATPSVAAESAREALVNFFEALHAGRYVEAAELYGGSYEIPIDHNPPVDPNDHPALLRNACTINGAQCLLIRSVALRTSSSNSGFVFLVQFQNEDGTRFEIGQCCGGNAADFKPVWQFVYTVVLSDDGEFLVQDLPPYVP